MKKINLNASTGDLLLMVTGFILAVDIIISLDAFFDTFPLTWNFILNYPNIWINALLGTALCAILSIFCFLKKYIAFPILLACSIYTFKASIENMIEIFRYGFIYPVDNLTGIIGIVELILSLFGTFYWFNQSNKFKKINFEN